MKGLFFLLFFGLLLLPKIGYSVGRTWYQRAHHGGDARHRVTAFSIGNKGYLGGGHVNSGVLITYSDYWEYDPATNTWTQIADYGGGQRYHSSAFVIGNAAYVGCGENNSGGYTKDFWKYVPEVNTWFPIAELTAIERRGCVAFAIDGIGYFGLGQSDAGYRNDFFRYDPETNVWSTVADFPGTPRNAAVSFTHNGKGYVGTGHITGLAVNDFYEYDPNTDTWTEKASVGLQPRQDAIGFSIDGKGYIGTGNDNIDQDFGDIWEYDFELDTWTQIEDFGGIKRRYGATFSIDNIVYVASGTDGTNLKDLWAWAPSVSIAESYLDEITISLYPNPSNDFIQINASLPENILTEFTYSITDINGKFVCSTKMITQSVKLSKSDFGKGMYFLNIAYKNQIFKSEKFIFN
jgi:N-acetylneuraminic acid mutarotase